jgi:hypothetical protein
MTGTYRQIRDAIANKQIVVARYNNHVRWMCPHAIGHKHGKEKALFYQFAGTSSSGLAPAGSPENWRCTFVGNVQIIEIREGDWITAENHSRPQTCIDEIDLEVRF